MGIKERLVALPKWPKRNYARGYTDPLYEGQYCAAVLARLELAPCIQTLLDHMREAAHLGLWHSFDSALDDARTILTAMEVPT